MSRLLHSTARSPHIGKERAARWAHKFRIGSQHQLSQNRDDLVTAASHTHTHTPINIVSFDVVVRVVAHESIAVYIANIVGVLV